MAGEETGAKKSEVRSLVLSAGGVDVAAVRALMVRDVPSGYSAQTADEIFDDYWRWFRRFRLMEIVGVLGLAAVALIAGMLGYMVWYFVLLGLAILSAVLFRSVVGQRERSITEIITQDCDSAKWRRFMELYDERNRRLRRRQVCRCDPASGVHFGWREKCLAGDDPKHARAQLVLAGRPGGRRTGAPICAGVPRPLCTEPGGKGGCHFGLRERGAEAASGRDMGRIRSCAHRSSP